MSPTKQEILAASAGWVAVTLNVLPDLGAGYLYQRRWKAYWITSALHSAGSLWGQFWVKEQRPEKNFKTSSSAWLDWSHSQPALPSKQAWR